MDLRPPTANERALLEKLAAVRFQGAKEICDQLQSLQVRIIDKDGSLELVSRSGSDANVIGFPLKVSSLMPME
jgi:hypothetical protein